VPGFLAAVELVQVPPLWTQLYHYAWFLSFGISFVLYALLMAGQAGPEPKEAMGWKDE
jgi:cytosine/uracil/thiamine/allantoin permease